MKKQKVKFERNFYRTIRIPFFEYSKFCIDISQKMQYNVYQKTKEISDKQCDYLYKKIYKEVYNESYFKRKYKKYWKKR